MSTLSFVIVAMGLLAPNRDHEVLAAAIAARVDAEPALFKGDDDKRRTAAWLVAIAYRESSLRVDAVGDHGGSYCAFQVNRTSGGTKAMLRDAYLCVDTAFPLLRTSMRLCPAFPLAWYAVGGDAASACASPRAQRLSRDRMALAQRLLSQVAATSFFCPASGRLPTTVATSEASCFFLPIETILPREHLAREAGAHGGAFCPLELTGCAS